MGVGVLPIFSSPDQYPSRALSRQGESKLGPWGSSRLRIVGIYALIDNELQSPPAGLENFGGFVDFCTWRVDCRR